MEDVEDEEKAIPVAKKKKKKKPKKKKKSTDAKAELVAETFGGVSPALEPSVPEVSPSTPAVIPEALPKKKRTVKMPQAGVQSGQPPPQATASKPVSSTLPYLHTGNAIPQEQIAQSARNYLQSEGLVNAGKKKIKSRPGPATAATVPEKTEFFDKFNDQTRGKGIAKANDGDEKGGDEKQDGKLSFFSRLSKKATSLMHQLLGTADDEKKGSTGMKWEHFLKVTRVPVFTFCLKALITEFRSCAKWASLMIRVQQVLVSDLILPVVKTK